MRKMIVRRMQDEHISPEQMAKCFGISVRTWFYWLAEPEKRLTIERLQTIARILGLSREEVTEVMTW